MMRKAVRPRHCAMPWLIVLMIVVMPARPAQAHASLLSATPAEGVTIFEPPKSITLNFNEPVSPLAMRLVRPNGKAEVLSAVRAENSTVVITAPQMQEQGSYVLSWRVISADGHPVGGVVPFALGHPSNGVSAPPIEGARMVHAAIWAAQFMLACALFFGVGGAAFIAWLAAERRLLLRNFLIAMLACGILAAVVSLPLQGLDALAQPLSQALRPSIWAAGFATSWGATVAVAVAALGAGLIAIASRSRTLARASAVAGIAGIGMALIASGHASSAPPHILTVPAIFLHGICIAFWIGSLLPLAVAVRAGDRLALDRFSRLIPLPLILLIASGIALAFVQLDRPDALWTTAYGWVLSGKIVIVLVLLALAALNRYALVPRLATSSGRRLVTVITAEFALTVAILGLVGLWRFTPPPRALAAAETTYIHFHGDKAMAQIDLTPERGRGAAVSIDVTDSDLHPIAAEEVSLAIWNPGAGIEPIRRQANLVAGGVWRVSGLNVPVAGVWRMRVEILVSDFDKIVLEDNVELPRAP